MPNFIIDLLSQKSSASTMRVMSIMALLTGIVLAFIGIFKDSVDYMGLSALVGVFLGAAFGGKVMQKRIENSHDKD